MTVHFEFPWTKRKRELERLAALENKIAVENQMCNSAPAEPYRPPHPCDSRGHDYIPLKTARELILTCNRCADVQRVLLRTPKTTKAAPAPQSRWSPAHLV